MGLLVKLLKKFMLFFNLIIQNYCVDNCKDSLCKIKKKQFIIEFFSVVQFNYLTY